MTAQHTAYCSLWYSPFPADCECGYCVLVAYPPRESETRERWSLCSLYICERDAHPVPPLGKTRDSPDNRTPVEANCIFSLPARQTVSACIFQLTFTTLLSWMNVFKFVAKQPHAQGKERRRVVEGAADVPPGGAIDQLCVLGQARSHSGLISSQLRKITAPALPTHHGGSKTALESFGEPHRCTVEPVCLPIMSHGLMFVAH